MGDLLWSLWGVRWFYRRWYYWRLNRDIARSRDLIAAQWWCHLCGLCSADERGNCRACGRGAIVVGYERI